jgi:hypothetical protein
MSLLPTTGPACMPSRRLVRWWTRERSSRTNANRDQRWCPSFPQQLASRGEPGTNPGADQPATLAFQRTGPRSASAPQGGTVVSALRPHRSFASQQTAETGTQPLPHHRDKLHTPPHLQADQPVLLKNKTRFDRTTATINPRSVPSVPRHAALECNRQNICPLPSCEASLHHVPVQIAHFDGEKAKPVSLFSHR